MSSKDPMCKYEITAVSGNVWVSTDRDGLSDPYIVMKKKGLLGKTLFETPVVNDSMSPVWNFTEVRNSAYFSQFFLFFMIFYDFFDIFCYFSLQLVTICAFIALLGDNSEEKHDDYGEIDG
eukprot:TRINITY_DN4372_c0_g1_i2.p1 TRINITY_DN4372_c0_g1~~TRINITY_DN4372_c0_g1_i2.p1  ORF type:complete len:121 (-),score=18.78 TRINITY_DN4372_c0_g1_i2:197-559(-)